MMKRKQIEAQERQESAHAEMTAKEPLFWYSEYWLHYIYSRGIECALRTVAPLPLEYPDGDGTKTKGNTSYFYWKPLPQFEKAELFPFTIPIPKYRLFARRKKEEERTEEFTAVVDMHIGEDPWRLYAARDFDIGDAMLFISEFEETTRSVVLGGICARVSDSEKECNSYLTAHRMLRCKLPIRKGDEIIRWNNTGPKVEYFENIDQAVISPEKMMVGRIGTEMVGAACKSLAHFPEVHFPETSYEIARNRHVRVYKPMNTS